MKKLICLLLALCLLTGCGGAQVSTPPAASDVPEDAHSMIQEDDFNPSEEQAPEAASTASEEASAPESASVPSEEAISGPGPSSETEEDVPGTPVAASLAELFPTGVKVYLDGIQIQTLHDNGTVLIPESDVVTAYPELACVGMDYDVGSAQYYDLYGNLIELPMAVSDGTETPIDRPEGGGILFRGENDENWIPLGAFCDEVGLRWFWDEAEQAFFVIKDRNLDISGGYKVPTPMYHEVGDDVWGIESLFVSPENMRKQLQYLSDNGFDTIFFSDLDHLEDYDKPILLTFDDGYIGNYTELFPLLKEFNMKATIFVITNSLGLENYLTEDMVREMSDSGLVSIQSHTVHHAYLGEISYEEQEYQLRQSYLDIARITGKAPYVLSYPTGSYNDDTLEIARKYYCFGIKMNGGTWFTGGDNFLVDRLYVARSTEIDEYASIVTDIY